MKWFDSLVNFVSGLGTDRDKRTGTGYSFLELDPQTLEAMYRSAWLPAKIVDIPAEDMCRKWRDWQADPKQITAIEAEEERLGVQGKLLEAMKRARLKGGAALFIGDGSSDPSLPLDPSTIKRGGLRYLTVLSRIQLSAGDIGLDPESDDFAKPVHWRLSGGTRQLQIHPSRLVVFKGADRLEDTATDGWGDSVLQRVYTAVRDCDSSFANVASLIFEAKVDVIRIPNMMSSLSDEEYKSRLLQRFQLAAAAKGINGTLMLDKEEEYEAKELTFGALADLLDRFIQVASGAADIPVTRLFNQSPAGMNATGESDLRNYYDGLQSGQNLELRPAMRILDECLIRSALGSRPESIHYVWAPLWQVSAKEQAEIGVAAADTISKLAATQLWAPQALAEAGANMLVERSVLPGFEESIKDAPVWDPTPDPTPDPNNPDSNNQGGTP